MLGSKPINFPIDFNHKTGMSTKGKKVDKTRYQKLVRKLIYLSHTRLDISFYVGVVSQLMHDPMEEHLEAVYQILRHLKKNPGRGLMFKMVGGDLTIEAYTDADWARSIIDRRSTSGWCRFVGGNLVTWRSKKQSVVARSSAEAEYAAIALGICELLWLKRLRYQKELSTFLITQSSMIEPKY